MRHIHTSTLFSAIAGAALAIIAASTALAAGPQLPPAQLPPAEFRPLPVGTELEYDKFSCTVQRGKPFESLCIDFDGRKIHHYGQFQLVDNLPKIAHFTTIAPLECPVEYRNVYTVRRIDLKQDAIGALRSLWPLEVGKKIEYSASTRYTNSWGETQDPVTIRVTGTEDLAVNGNVHRTYIVEQDVDRSVNCVASYKRTFWFDPALGVTVKERIEPTGNRRLKAKTSEIELVSVNFPPGTPVAAIPPSAATQPAAAQVATAESFPRFIGPPRGTVIEYDTWTCEITRSSNFVTECRDPELGRVGFYGGFEPIGSYADIPPLRALVPLISYDLGYESDRALKVGAFALNDKARSAIESLWPLKPGNFTSYEVTYDARGSYGGDVQVKAETKVEGQELLTVGGNPVDTFVISQTVRRKVHQTRGEGGPDDSYLRTVWLDAKRGIIVKDRREWLTGYRKGKTKKYELVNVTFPKDAPLVANIKPTAGTVVPAGKPPAQSAVTVELDKQGPIIEIASEFETDTPVVAIEGRVVDSSRIVLVQFDGQPVPMGSDGTLSITRAVPPGTSTFTIVAYDEWGNAGQQVVTVTHRGDGATSVANAAAPPKLEARVQADAAAPVIALPETLSTTQRTIELGGRVSDASNIIEVTVEGRPVALSADGSIVVKRAVSVGSNTIRIAAIDEWGNKAEMCISVERRRPFADINFGTYHAIVIGNNDYAGMPKLQSAVNDAQAVAAALKQDYGFEVDLLIDATRSDIINAMAKARKTLKADDNLLIYYAGHGVIDTYAEEGFWLPVDAEADSPANWVSNGDITNMLRAIRAKHVLVVADSCYSGTLVRAVTAKIDTANEREAWLKKMVKKRTRTALVSGGLEPVVDSGGEGGHSVFAKAFLDALRANEDVLEGERLFSKIKRPVALESDQTPQYSDVRRAGHDGGDFMFVRK